MSSSEKKNKNHDLHFDSQESSLWEKYQTQLKEPWPFLVYGEFKAWYMTQEKRRKKLLASSPFK